MPVTRKITAQGPRGGRLTIPPEMLDHLGVTVGDLVELAIVLNDSGQSVVEVRKS